MDHISLSLNSRSVRDFLLNHLDNILLKLRPQTMQAPDLTFDSNQSFWERMIRQGNNIRLHNVQLNNFQIVDWYPRVPGTFFSIGAERIRRQADRSIIREGNSLFYDPYGKSQMIDGGLGSVKFKPFVIDSEYYWLCTATSDSFCHSGIPLFIPNKLFSNIDIASFVQYSISGIIKFLPERIDKTFMHHTGIPRIYLEVDKLKVIDKNSGSPILITPMLYFESRDDGFSGRQVTYAQCSAGSTYNPDLLADWFHNYTSRYSGKIITNFDEQTPIFENAAFSLQKVMSGDVSTQVLNTYNISPSYITTEAIHMTKISTKIGDNNTIHGNITTGVTTGSISYGSIENASELQMALKNLNDSIKLLIAHDTGTTETETITKDIKSINEELGSKVPRKNLIGINLVSIAETAGKLGSAGIKVIEAVNKIGPLVSGLIDGVS